MYSVSELIRFIFVGVFVLSLDIGAFMALYSAGSNVMIANGIAMFLGFLAGLIMHHYITFQQSGALSLMVMMRYVLSLIFNYTIATIIIESLLYLESPAIIAKFFSTLVAAGSNYLLSRHFVFKISTKP